MWLSRERARDVARRLRARTLQIQPLSQVVPSCAFTPLQALVGSSAANADNVNRLYHAIETLKDRQAIVIRMLIAGQSQTTIAAELHVSEGTVSRLRTRAIAMLRHRLTTK